ncbi:polysaccharide biosynthesis/export family protein [Erythrobacter dokdonensis]|uniref:Polysaccharide export protein n=1 Tax=Erythrobacter dokdonensis DSW-74 TaxID=1300349 RepID=A0A1A7BJ47_9SPHN|nr:polysaccharide biosynthesis/export family protein [Erythrobacter dokdonensis]OBV11220.1 Polysaccharide export protein [Erythrobacter dokdonensis DSW-74]
MTLLTSNPVRKASLVSLAMALLAGCASTPDPIIGASVIQPRTDLGQSDYSFQRPTTYQLRPADKISVRVFREPDFSLDSVQIGVEGNVSLPMLGSIPAAGMTAKQFEQEVTRRLAAVGLKSPMVSINIAEYASHLVTVEGAVETPGVYTFQPGARLSSAIALAKGPTRTAKVDQVAVFRESADGIMVAKFDYGQLRQGTMLDPVLQPGDRVVMGTDGLSVFWNDLLRALPAFGVFAAAGLRN